MDENYRQIAAASLWSRVRLAYGLIPFTTVLRRHNIDIESSLAAAGIPRFGLVDPGYRISIEQETAFVTHALRHLTHEHASLEVAREYGLRSFSVLGLAMQACANAMEMLQLILAYPRLAWGMFDASLWVSEQTLLVRFSPQASLGAAEAFLLERDLGCGLVLIQEAFGKPLIPTEVKFRHARKGAQQGYEDFFSCPVSFGASHTELSCRLEDVMQPLPHADALAKEFYEAQCARMAASLDQPFTYSNTVRERLLRSRPMPDLESLARQLHMTPRTLQRRLAAEGLRFSDLLREVRLQRAEQLISGSGWRLDRVATELGFTDAVAFSHAFKSWTGKAPGAWARQASQD